ncbi:MAG: hypothetical protein AAF531_19285 [Actinomycetota bacterium]
MLVATSCGSSPDEEEEVVLPSAVGQIVADVTATCGSLASQAEAINRDVQGGLVDTTPEWEKVDEARVAYEEAMVAIGAWQRGLVAAIRAGAATTEIGLALEDIPMPEVGPEDGSDSSLDLAGLHDAINSGTVEPPPFNQGLPPGQSALAAAPLARAVPILIRYGPAVIKAAGAVVGIVEGWQAHQAEQAEALRRQLASALDEIDCPTTWPGSLERPDVLWDESTCAPTGRFSAVVGWGNGGELFELTAGQSAIAGIEARHGALLDAIGVVWQNGSGTTASGLHGGSGGGAGGLTLQPGESIRHMTIWADTFINAVRFTTDTGRSWTAGQPGPTNASPNPMRYERAVPEGTQLIGLRGQWGPFRPDGSSAVNAIGCIYGKES